MEKYKKLFIVVSILLVCLTLSHINYKNRLHGNTYKEILMSLSKLYDSHIEIVEIVEINNSKIVAFITNGNTGIATFIKDENNKYKYLESMWGNSEYVVHYGNINTKRMCAIVTNNENISTVLFKKDNIIEKEWVVKTKKPTLFYYNDESIQNTDFEFEFILLDKQGNEVN